jgi:hypothetical protein
MIHVDINQEIQNAIIRHTKNICGSLASKYNFDVQDAITHITNNNIGVYNDKFNEKVGIFQNSHSDILNNRPSNEQSEPEKKKRGRPKKVIDEVKDDKPKKKRGRPKKENKVTIVDDTDEEIEVVKPSTEDLIAASMIDVSNEHDGEPDGEEKDGEEKDGEEKDGELKEENVSYEEKEINVVEWNWKGDTYLKDDNNNVYCSNTHEIIGRYSQENDSIVS